MSRMFQILKPGGRFAVSDVVVRGDVPAEVRKNVELWIGCIAGALQDQEYSSKLVAAGFEAVEIETTRIYEIEDARKFLAGEGIDVDAVAPQVAGKFMSAFVRAMKPTQAAADRTVAPANDKAGATIVTSRARVTHSVAHPFV